MADLPSTVVVNEEGPREGFQIEPGPIGSAAKVRFIEALAQTGVRKIDCVSFVHPKRVPGMADADEVMRLVRRVDGIRYTGLWLNERGFERALSSGVDLQGALRLTASETFCRNNTGMTKAETLQEQSRWMRRYLENEVPVEVGYVMTAFGCNFEGVVPIESVLECVGAILDLVDDNGLPRPRMYLADTVGHASPRTIEGTIGAVREAWPDLELGLHLHDTRGLGIANAYAAMRLGVDHFDSACAGLGGCPFAGHAGAAGNICTEELVFLCEELGIETGVDLEAMIECARLAEDIVGHQLPGKLTRGGSLRELRARVRA